MKTAAEVCPLCAGSGWKPVPGTPDRGVTRCDCQLRARGGALIAAARIPKRYEHCELSNFRHFREPIPRIALAHISAARFVEEFIRGTRLGCCWSAASGPARPTWQSGILKALIAARRESSAFFTTIADLLKQIQDSYNPSVQATELRSTAARV